MATSIDTIGVINRLGQRRPIDIRRIREVVEAACQGLDGVDPLELELDARIHFFDGISTRAIQQTLIRVANEKTSVEQPNWTFVAARLLLHDLYQEAARNRGEARPGYGSFPRLVRMLTEMGRYAPEVQEGYRPDELEELGAYLKPERDRLLPFPGLKHLADRYAIRGYDDEVLELPQEVFLGVAAYLALAEAPDQRVAWAKRFYDVLSRLEITMATPTLANARRPQAQMSSCFIDTPEDSITGIFEGVKVFAKISQNGGGMGVYLGKLRAMGADIRGYKGAAGGVIPWIRLYNDTAVSVNQLGQRAGAVSVWLDIWHKDIVDFLDLKTNNGDERRKAHDVFPGVCVPDRFYRAVEQDETWYLFDPHEIVRKKGFALEDAYGEEWERRYQACIDDPAVSRMEIPALDLMALVMKSAYETGGPFIFNRDTANRLNPNRHAGMVYASNLCTEIVQNMSPTISEEALLDADGTVVTRQRAGDFVVCNLSSIHLGRTNTPEKLAEVIPIQVRMLDNVITLNHLPVPQATRTNRQYRAIGIGVHGYHQYLVQQGVAWESEEHVVLADRLFEEINYQAIKASMELAREKGRYPLFAGSDWDTGAYFDKRGYTSPRWRALRQEVQRYGLRNGYLLAVAPTGSTSVIAGSTATVDPVFKRVFTEEKKGLIVRQVAPELSAANRHLYREAHEIDQRWSIRAAAARQRHIDQSQSLNLYAVADLDEAQFLEWYLTAWRLGIKTIYYFRNFEAEEAETSCEACQV